MNKHVAAIFSDLLSLLHVVAILLLIACVIGRYNGALPDIFLKMSSAEFYSLLILIALGYVISVGLLATFVAMNDHLKMISNQLVALRHDLHHIENQRTNN